MMISIYTQCATSTRAVMLAGASAPRAFVRDLNRTAPIADVRDKGAFVGTPWSPPV